MYTVKVEVARRELALSGERVRKVDQEREGVEGVDLNAHGERV